jgi:hypothetical protein
VDSADEVQQWKTALQVGLAITAVVVSLLLMLVLYVPASYLGSRYLPEPWKFLPSALYAAGIPLLSQRVLGPLCVRLNAMETHSSKVRLCEG